MLFVSDGKKLAILLFRYVVAMHVVFCVVISFLSGVWDGILNLI